MKAAEVKALSALSKTKLPLEMQETERYKGEDNYSAPAVDATLEAGMMN